MSASMEFGDIFMDANGILGFPGRRGVSFHGKGAIL
jgi:hypothetical protein